MLLCCIHLPPAHLATEWMAFWVWVYFFRCVLNQRHSFPLSPVSFHTLWYLPPQITSWNSNDGESFVLQLRNVQLAGLPAWPLARPAGWPWPTTRQQNSFVFVRVVFSHPPHTQHKVGGLTASETKISWALVNYMHFSFASGVQVARHHHMKKQIQFVVRCSTYINSNI